MNNRYTTANAYNDFSQVVTCVENWLSKLSEPVLSKNSDIVRQRITQRLVEWAFIPYIKLIKQRVDAGLSPLPLSNTPIYLNGVAIDAEIGHVAMLSMVSLRAAMEFFAHWALALGAILGGIRLRATINPATLVYGVGPESLFLDGTDKRFVSYCQESAVKPLRAARQLLVQSTLHHGSLSNSGCIYVKHPHLALVKGAKLGWLKRLGLLISHLVLPFKFALAVFRFPPFILLGRDFALAGIVASLDAAKQIEAVILTNSTGKVQPLWMRGKRNFLVHMVWYSQNTKPHIYREHPVKSQIPHLRHIAADVHWVWTAGYKDYLTETLIFPGTIEVVGPILWCLPETVSNTSNYFNLAVFDVTPISDSLATDFGMLDNFLCAENMMQFLKELVAVCDEISESSGINFNIMLKHKRETTHLAWAAEYLELVSDLAARDKIKLVNHQANIFSMVSECALTVAIPYSSPIYASAYMGVPAIYFDPTGQLLPTHEKADKVCFASGKAELTKIITKIVTKI